MIEVRPATTEDRQQLANLIHFETHVHRHLDWRPPLDWLGMSPYLVAAAGNQIVASLICPPDPPNIGWIRLFAVSSNWAVLDAWQLLWNRARQMLVERGNILSAAIPLQPWFKHLLEGSGFRQVDEVISLTWARGTTLPDRREVPARIRPMNFDDLEAVADLDGQAFGALWRNTIESLQMAYKQHAVATVAENDEGILGYQISTASPMGGHLARLAVSPSAQGKGIGIALVRDVLDQFDRRGAIRVSVNTQQSNPVSLSLYNKTGFRLSGENYPVYIFGNLPDHGVNK